MIPQTTSPLAKAIRTTEGILVVVADVVVGATSAIDPHILPPKIAAVVVAVQHVGLLISRGQIKAAALKWGAAAVAAPDIASAEKAILHDIETTPGT